MKISDTPFSFTHPWELRKVRDYRFQLGHRHKHDYTVRRLPSIHGLESSADVEFHPVRLVPWADIPEHHRASFLKGEGPQIVWSGSLGDSSRKPLYCAYTDEQSVTRARKAASSPEVLWDMVNLGLQDEITDSCLKEFCLSWGLPVLYTIHDIYWSDLKCNVRTAALVVSAYGYLKRIGSNSPHGLWPIANPISKIPEDQVRVNPFSNLWLYGESVEFWYQGLGVQFPGQESKARTLRAILNSVVSNAEAVIKPVFYRDEILFKPESVYVGALGIAYLHMFALLKSSKTVRYCENCALPFLVDRESMKPARTCMTPRCRKWARKHGGKLESISVTNP
jgi:hypothetical protein